MKTLISKKWLTLLSSLVLFIFVPSFNFAQVPQGMNYQAIARDGSGNPVTGATINVKLSILSDSAGFYPGGAGTYVYEEQHTGVKTNAFGLFTIVLGSGTWVQGSAPAFNAINWLATPLYLGSKIYYQNSWKTMGSAKLWTVPYAMISSKAGGIAEGSKLTVLSNNDADTNALFIVKRKDGQIVFAVYNEGVRAYVDNGAKGAKGGFAIGGFGTAKAPSQSFMMISPDSARIYVDETVAKGTKGGFAIGGFNSGKGTINEFMFMTPENYFIGHSSGQLITTGTYNSTLGYQSGLNLTAGGSNIFVGYKSGFTTDAGSSNVFVGNTAGYKNKSGNYNIILGRGAGYSTTSSSNIFLGDLTANYNTTGSQNVMIGDWAGYNNTLGNQNVFLGAESGWFNTTGNYNNFMGFESGYENNGGSYNSFIGYQTGYNNTTGEKNTYIGYQAGYSGATASGSNNIFMGVESGYSNTTGYDNIAIGNKAGRSNVGGIYNVMIGSDAGNMNVAGNYNTLLGYKAGGKTTADYGTMLGYLAGNASVSGISQTMIGYMAGSTNTGSYNTFVGTLAGGNGTTGNFNTYVGLAAGNYATGDNNVFIGKWAGWGETSSNKLIIENNYSLSDNLNNALIYGDFTGKFFRVNGEVLSSTTKSLGYAADFRNTGGASGYYGINITAGSSDGTGNNYMIDFNSMSGAWKGSILMSNSVVSVYNVSDARQKENIIKSEIDGLKILNTLPVVEYNFTKSPGAKHTGYVAQDALKVLPEMVIYNEKADAYAVSTSYLIPVLHKAILEQQAMIETQAERIDALETLVKQLMNK